MMSIVGLFWLRFTLTVIGLLLSLVPLTQAQDKPPFHLPCDQVLRMGLDKYVAHYTAANHDDSTAGNIQACDSYARCRRSANDAQSRALSPMRRDQVAQTRRTLDALADACDVYTYLSAGGGTMWSQMAAGEHAVREDFLATLIAALRWPASRSFAARRQADAALRAARQSFNSLRVPRTEGAAMMDPSYLSEYRTHTYPAAQAAFARLQTLIMSLPDASARRGAREAQKVLAAPAQNLH